MGDGINKLFGIIPEGSRKMVVTIFSVTALALMHLLGEVKADEAIACLWKLVGLFMGGNAAEHIGKGMKKLPAGAAGQGGHSRIGLVVIVATILVLAMAFFPAKASAFELVDYVKESMGGIVAYEFLEIEDQAIGGKYDAKYFKNLISPSVSYISSNEKSAWGIGASVKMDTLAEMLKVDNPLAVFAVPVGLNVGYGTGKKCYLWVHAEIL